MYCLDEDQIKGLKIYGDEKNQNHSRLELLILPCNYLHTEWGYTGDAIHPECIGNLEAQMEYLGPLSFVTYHTRERFDQEGFGEESIKKQSFIWH